MGPNDEIIDLEIDSSQTDVGAARANKNLESIEKTAGRVTTSIGRSSETTADSIVRITDRSRNSIERLVAAAEKRANSGSLTGVAKLVAERDQQVGRVSGDPKAVDRITAAYGRLIATQKQADNAALLDKATAASRRAGVEAQKFDSILRAQNKSAQEGLAALERRAQVAGKSASERIGLQEQDALKKYGVDPAAVGRVRAAFDQIRQAAHEKPEGPSFIQGIIGGGLALEGINQFVGVIKGLTVDSALYAARVEQLGVAMHAIGAAHNFSAQTMDVYAGRVHKLGVSLEETRAQLTQLTAVGLDPKYATQIASLSQNIGRVRGIPTAEVFEKLTTGIITGRTQELHYLGLMVQAESAHKRFAASIGTTVDKLTDEQRTLAVLNEVLEKGKGYNNAYAASIGTIGGQLQSLPRLWSDVKNLIGKGFSGELNTVARPLLYVLQKINDYSAGRDIKNPDPGTLQDRERHTSGLLGVGVRAAGLGAGLAQLAIPSGITQVTGTITLLAVALSSVIDVISVAVDKWGAFKKAAGDAGLAAVYGIETALKILEKENTAFIRTQANSIISKRLQESTSIDLDRLGAAIATKKAIVDISRLSPREASTLATQSATKQIEEEVAWLQKRPAQIRESEKAVFDAQAKRLEGAAAIRAKYEATIRDKSIDESGNLRTLPTRALANYRTAESIEITNERLKLQRDLEREIVKEQGNQLEGSHKILFDGDLEVKRLREQGNGTAKLVSLTQELAQERVRAAVYKIEQQAEDASKAALVSELDGYAKITAEIQLQRDKLADKDLLSAKTLDYLQQEEESRKRILDRQNRDETLKIESKVGQDSVKADIDRLNDRREHELASIDSVVSYDLRSKLGLNERKLEIETRYVELIAAREQEARQLRFTEELRQLDQLHDRKQISDEDYNRRRSVDEQVFAIDAIRGAETASKQITVAKRQAEREERKEIVDYYHNIFDSLKTSAGSLFDALISRSKSVGDVIKDTLKAAFLTPFKEIVTSQVAKSMMALFYGPQAAAIGASGQNKIGWLGALFGKGKQGGETSAFGIPGAPGGTSGFAGPVNLGGGKVLEFPKSKLDYPGHLGDLSLTSGVVPVFVVNMGAQQIAQQQGGSVSLLKSAAGVAGLGALLSGIGGGVASASSIPAGAVSSAITYAGSSGAISTGAPSIFGAASALGPGGTGGFAGPLGSAAGGAGGFGNIFSGAGLLGGLKGLGGGLKNIFTGLGNIGRGTLGPGSSGGALAQRGFGGLTGGALLAGGGIAALDGLRRGGLTGLVETAGGGAAIGAKFGGLEGALIGGAIGAAAGAIRLLFPGIRKKVHDAIKSAYGVDIKDHGILNQVVKMVQSNYGGNVGVAIRSKDIRDLVQLYAQSTDQHFPTQFAPRPVNLIEQGGTLYQQAGAYENGRGIGYQSSLQQYTGGFNIAPSAPSYANGVVTVSGSYDRGGVVGFDQLAKIHAREMVLPASLSQGLERLIDSNSQSSGWEGAGELTATVRDLAEQVKVLASGGMTVNASLQLDGKATDSFVQGRQVQAISDNPAVVSAAASKELRANRGRREQAALLRSPSTLLA